MIRKSRLDSWCFLAAPLAALALLTAAGCSEPGTSASQLADDPTTPPEIKAIVDSDKTEKEKRQLIKAALGVRRDPPDAKSQAKKTKKKK